MGGNPHDMVSRSRRSPSRICSKGAEQWSSLPKKSIRRSPSSESISKTSGRWIVPGGYKISPKIPPQFTPQPPSPSESLHGMSDSKPQQLAGVSLASDTDIEWVPCFSFAEAQQELNTIFGISPPDILNRIAMECDMLVIPRKITRQPTLNTKTTE